MADIHLRAFPYSALSKLGHEAVRRYYEWQLLGPHDVIAVGAFSSAALLGFCFGGVFRGATSGFVRANRGFLARRLVRQPWLLTDPLLRDRMRIGARSLRRSERAGGSGEAVSDTFGILSVAVDPRHHRSGVGTIIMGEMEQHARTRKAVRMHLSVEPKNSPAIRFYERLGWETAGRDAGTDRMIKPLRDPDGPGPPVTVIMPIRNEAAFIERSLGAVLRQRYPAMQVLVVDGMSDDGTRQRLGSLLNGHTPDDTEVSVLDNPSRTVPSALNTGLRYATGDIIVRVDGHCEIPHDYVARCVALLNETGTDCVGGVIDTVGETRAARAIASAQSSQFGVGNAAFRTGRRRAGLADTVAFGAYRRSVFERIGTFDLELVRNQDDDLNFRLLQSGGAIWLDPSLSTRYHSRVGLSGLWNQYYQYGMYKVRLMQKRGRLPSARQAVPALFVAALFSSLAAAAMTRRARMALAIVGPYAIANMSASSWASRRDPATLPILPAAFATMHLAYGTGFIAGLWRWRAHFGRHPEAHDDA
ncbi:MAG: GNAT family N-acetyltransferase [Actinobacteria bacterium]|nr:GNAT family N-acetyltransferase [Actinomycetota bacterium]